MQILYNDDPLQDTINILEHIDKFAGAMKIQPITLDTAIVEKVVQEIRTNFPCEGGVEKASAFKQVAYFMCHFIAAKPILEPFPMDIVGTLARIQNHQNAMLALDIAENALCKSKIERTDGTINIDKRVGYSKHSYIDIIDAISGIDCGSFGLLSVFIEQLVYKANPDCQYKSAGW